MRTIFQISLLGFLVLPTISLHAQEGYKVFDKKLDPATERLALEYNRSGKGDSAAGIKAIEETCTAYISRFTEAYDTKQPKPPNFQNVRRQLDQLLVEAAPGQPKDARSAIVRSLIRYAGGISEGKDFSPAARINCVVVLGELDEARNENNRMPSAQAREKLLNLLASPTTPGYLKAVVLEGLERHASEPTNGWTDAVKAKVAQAAAVYATKPPEHNSNRQLNTWLARRGLDVMRTVGSKDAIDAALAFLGDPNELPSLRFSALQYLNAQDLTALTPEQKNLHVIALANYLRSQLVGWYQLENDRQRRASGQAGDIGGFGGGRGGGDFSGGFGDSDNQNRGQDGRGPKPIESQTWDALRARRQLNQITQYAHVALDGKPTEKAKVVRPKALASPEVGIAPEFRIDRLIAVLNDLQSSFNNANRITNVQSLLNQTKSDIEALMQLTKSLPGYAEKYTQQQDKTDELEKVVEENPSDAGQPDGAGQPDQGGQGGSADQPGDKSDDAPKDGSGGETTDPGSDSPTDTGG